MTETGAGRPVLRGLIIGLVFTMAALALLGGVVTLCSHDHPDPTHPAGLAAPQVLQIGRGQLRPDTPATSP